MIDGRISIISATGKVLVNRNVNGVNEIDLDNVNLQPGLYFLLISGKSRQTIKLIVE